MSTIEQDVRDFLRDYLFLADIDGLSNDDSFLENGIIDSMGILHLVAFVEKQYGMRVQDQDLVTENWDSISRIGRYVRDRLSAVKAASEAAEAPAISQPYVWHAA